MSDRLSVDATLEAVNTMTMILTGLGIAYLINWSYLNGRRDGGRGCWRAAWRRARERFQPGQRE